MKGKKRETITGNLCRNFASYKGSKEMEKQLENNKEIEGGFHGLFFFKCKTLQHVYMLIGRSSRTEGIHVGKKWAREKSRLDNRKQDPVHKWRT